ADIPSFPTRRSSDLGFLSCVSCYTVERIARSRYNVDELVQVLKRMRTYAQGSTPLRPQVRPGVRDPSPAQQQQLAKFAQYLSTTHLSKVAKWENPLKTHSRLKDKETRVII